MMLKCWKHSIILITILSPYYSYIVNETIKRIKNTRMLQRSSQNTKLEGGMDITAVLDLTV